jgi:hypothetical protein
VAGGAGVGDAVEADAPLGETDRQFLALLPVDAEGGVADAGLGQLVREHARQNLEYPVRNSRILLRADGAVLEALGRVGERRRAVVAQEAVVAGQRRGGDQEQRQGKENFQFAGDGHDARLRKSSGIR